MPKSVALSPLAEADLEDIWVYTALEWSAEQAEVYTNEIIDTFEDIALGKKVGRPALVREGYSKALIGRHVIYYQIRGDVITIIRVLHQSMDIERHL